MIDQGFDYIVIGGGSAGCAVASRLTEDKNVTVCLLEAGGPDDRVCIQAPAGVVVMLPIAFKNEAFKTVPQRGLNGRQGYPPCGKVRASKACASSTPPSCRRFAVARPMCRPS